MSNSISGAGRLSPLEAARACHRLAEVAARTGIPLGTTVGTVTVSCPMPSHGHPDRTPSMRLYLDDDRFYCFGCRAKGDVVQWAQDSEGVGPLTAARTLDGGGALHNAWAGQAAGRPSSLARSSFPQRRQGATVFEQTGKPGQVEQPELARTSPARVQAALAAAWAYYTYKPLHARGAGYLGKRGIDVGVLEAHTGRAEVGHTPANRVGLVITLQAKGFTPDELVDAGLAHRHSVDGLLTDFYRQRVLVPVRDRDGQVVGMVGRNVGGPSFAKYKNPPRTAVYDKSVNLYQTLPAPTARRGQVVVVEGTLDALAIAVAAINAGKAAAFCPVTQSGRELSDAQVGRIVAMCADRLVLGFDGDDAGRESATRYARVFARAGKTVSVTLLGHGHDPASWLAERGERGLSSWSSEGSGPRRTVRGAQSVIMRETEDMAPTVGTTL
jgi:DNA primase